MIMNNTVSVPGALAAVGNVLFPAFDYMQGCFPRHRRKEVLKQIAPTVRSSQLFETFFEKCCYRIPRVRAEGPNFGGMIVPLFKKEKRFGIISRYRAQCTFS